MASQMLSDTRIHELAQVALKEPVLIQGLPGLGYVGKVAVDYFIEKLKPVKMAELYSSYLLFPDGILGIGRQRSLSCAGLLGATTGAYPDLEAARAVIQMLTGLVNIPVDLKELDTEIEDMRKKMERFRHAEVEEAKEGDEKPEEGKDRYIT